MAIRRSYRRLSAERIGAVARDLLDASTLCAISTVGPRGRAYVNTAYFAWSPELRIIWLSAPGAQHSRNLRANASAAVAVYDSSQTWGKPDRGIQLFGDANADGSDAEEIYAARFRAYELRQSYRFYELAPRRVKLFDEGALGAGTFVTALVRDGKLAWDRTEVYR
jgi:uncharacterized protein YhbP (UPF0306 family)